MAGLWEKLFGTRPASVTIEEELAHAILQRAENFSLRDALAIPALGRAVDLLVSVAATFQPVEYVAGTASPEQPRLIRRPDPYRTRNEWLEQTVRCLIERGEAFWLLGERLEGYPTHAIVLSPEEVGIRFDERRFQPVYTWREQELKHGVDIYHVAINRRPGELHGWSPLYAALPYLAILDAAERFAAQSFGSGGVPSTVLKHAGQLSKAEADLLKKQWAESRRDAALNGEPAVLSGGIEAEFPDLDPERMQLNEARSQGATTIARLLGIPAPLLLVELHGSSITYANVDAVWSLLTKVTILPRYLAPIEAALADLVPRTRTVRFSLMELVRADLKTRFDVYGAAIAAGILDTSEVRAFEGWPQSPPIDAPLYDPTPALEVKA